MTHQTYDNGAYYDRRPSFVFRLVPQGALHTGIWEHGTWNQVQAVRNTDRLVETLLDLKAVVQAVQRYI